MLNMDQTRRMRRLRWSGFLLVVLAYAISFFHRYSPATIASDLLQAFHASPLELGGLAATYFYVYMFMQIPTGILVDTWGPQRVVAAGGLIAAGGSIMFGLADTLGVASTGRMLIGLGVSVTFISLLKFNAVWFHDRHFGTMTGASVLIGNIGSLLAAAPLAWALQWTSWRAVFVLAGILSCILALLSWWWVHDHPGKAGLPSMRELDGKPAHPGHEGHWYDGLLSVLQNRATWPGLWVNMGLAGSLFAFAGLWAGPFLRDGLGMSRTEAAQHTTLLLAGFAIGALMTGAISDHLQKRKPVMLFAAIGYAVCWLPLIFATTLSSLASHVLFLLMGLFAPGFTLSWACAKEVNTPSLSGMAMSVVNIGAFLGAAILQPLVGWAIDRSHAQRVLAMPHEANVLLSRADFQSGIFILFLFVLMGLAGVFFVRETHCKYSAENL